MMLLTSVAETSFEMQKLTNLCLTKNMMLNSIAPIALKVYPALSTLKKLCLAVDEESFIDDDHGIAAFLAAAPNVTELELVAPEAECFNTVFDNHALESLTLRDVCGYPELYEGLLGPHQASLKRLCLHNSTVMFPNDSWSNVLRYISEHFTLEELEFRELNRGI